MTTVLKYTLILAVIVAVILAAVGMPFGLILCGQGQGHIAPVMQRHSCTQGLASAVFHLTTLFALLTAVILFVFAVHVRVRRVNGMGRILSEGPPRALLRRWELFRILTELRTAQKAMALGLVPQRHPTA